MRISDTAYTYNTFPVSENALPQNIALQMPIRFTNSVRIELVMTLRRLCLATIIKHDFTRFYNTVKLLKGVILLFLSQ